jgi:pimeloyl-ACP methyl ester carboxylesterase
MPSSTPSALPLVLIPGFGSDEALWHHQVEHLSDLSHPHVLVMTAQTSIGEMAERVLDEVPGRFVLVGQSMGGFVAHEVVRRASERVAKLALVCTSARPDEAISAEEQAALAEGINQVFEFDAKGEFKAVRPACLPRTIHPDLVDGPVGRALEAMLNRVLGKPGVFRRQIGAIQSRPDARPHMENIRCPTLVIAGRQDKWMPMELSLEQANGIPGAKLVVIEDCGHMPAMERPQATTAVLRYFLLS